jgi:hypothetical protein
MQPAERQSAALKLRSSRCQAAIDEHREDFLEFLQHGGEQFLARRPVTGFSVRGL